MQQKTKLDIYLASQERIIYMEEITASQVAEIQRILQGTVSKFGIPDELEFPHCPQHPSSHIHENHFLELLDTEESEDCVNLELIKRLQEIQEEYESLPTQHIQPQE